MLTLNQGVLDCHVHFDCGMQKWIGALENG